MRALFPLLALFSVGCLFESPAGIEPEKPIVVTARGAWTGEELAELQGACDAWKDVTAGALTCALGPDGDVFVERGPTGNDRDARLVRRERTLIIDADRMARDGFTLRNGVGALARNGFGMAANIGTHDGPGVMSAVDVKPDFTDADRDACRAAGFCR